MDPSPPTVTVPDDAATVWRYLDFTKFVFLLQHQALFFSRADRFVDRYEGTLAFLQDTRRPDLSRPDHERLARRFERERREVAMSCWHLNDWESAAMWELYLKSDEGVAIRSSFGRLRRALDAAEPGVRLGLVRYVDEKRDRVPQDDPLLPYLHKRRSYAHERELRALIHQPPGLPEQGLAVPVDLELLVERIYVAPWSPDWFQALVEAVAGRYGLSKEVVRSELGRDPLY